MKNILDFTFGDGITYLGPVRMFLSPVNYFLYGILHNSRDKLSEDIVLNFKKFSEVDSKLIYDILRSKIGLNNNKLILVQFLNIINCFGFGYLTLIGTSNGKILISLKRPHMGNLYKKFFNLECKFNIEEILSGFVENFLSNLYGKKISSIFINSNCGFVLKCNVSNISYKFETEKKYKLSNKKFTISSFLKEFIFSKKIGTNDNGTFSLGNIYAVCMPWFFGIDYLLTLIKSDGEFRDSLAKMEGGILVKINNFNKNLTSERLMSRILMTFGAAGLGKSDIIDLKAGVFKMSFDFDLMFGDFYSSEDLFLIKRNVAMIVCGAYEFAFGITVNFNFDGETLILKKVLGVRELSDVEKEIDKYLTVNNFIFKI